MSEDILSVLILDDDQNLSRSISLNLEHEGYNCWAIDNSKGALKLIEKENFDIALCDYKMPEGDGISFIKECKERSPDTDIIFMTGYGNTDIAVQALKAGAYDYLSKPFEIDELIFTLTKIKERESLKAENQQLKSEIEQQYNFSNIVARSNKMKEVFETVKRLVKFNTTVLIRGESGTGKEILARSIHHNSPRKGKPFIAINCGAIPENLMESELFGHKKGAFTDARTDKVGLFEEASGGTIFLDEVGEMPPHLQVKLLRVLQEQQIQRVGDEKTRSIDVRILAATLRDLERDVEDGRFRDDLLYRLNVITIMLPPLRDRTEDIPILIDHFINKYNQKLNTKIEEANPEAMKCMLDYPWKGNVRELENCIERALVLSNSNVIDMDSLPDRIKNFNNPNSININSIIGDNLSIKTHTEILEKSLITKALKKTSGNRTHASKLLEISHRALLYKIKKYSLELIGKNK